MRRFNLKHISALILILALLLLICACNNTPEPPTPVDPVDSSSESLTNDSGSGDSESQSSPVTPKPDDINIVKDGKSNYSIVRSSSPATGVLDVANNLLSAIRSATGLTIGFKDDYISWGETLDPDACEVLVGLTNRAESIEVMKSIGYGEWTVKTVGNKLVIAAWNNDALTAAFDDFKTYIESAGASGELSISGEYEKSGQTNDLLNVVPIYDTVNSKSVTSTEYLADQNYMVHITNTSADEYGAYLSKLKENGFGEYQKRSVNGNEFAIYTTDDYMVSAQFYPYNKTARVIIEDSQDMSVFEKQEYTKVCDSTLTMVGCEVPLDGGSTSQIGLCLIFTLEDGRLIVIDGGGYYSIMRDRLYESLRAASPDPDNIVVAAWIFTHPHGDHTGGFIMLSKSQYADKVKIENFISNFPTWDVYATVGDTGCVLEAREKMKEYADANQVKAHPGQVFQFANAELEILYTYDAILPFKLDTHNTTSMAFSVTIGGQKTIVLGDTQASAANVFRKMYGNYLKADIVNVTHHGLVGGANDTYAIINAPVALWTSGVNVYNERSKSAYNQTLIKTAKEILVAGDKITRLTLPYVRGN